MKEVEVIKRAYERERIARKKAEGILEKKSYELFLANQALASNNAILAEKVEEQTAKLKDLVDLTTTLLTPVTLDQIAESLVEISKDKFNVPFCRIYFWDEHQQSYVPRSSYSTPFFRKNEIQTSLLSTVVARAEGIIHRNNQGSPSPDISEPDQGSDLLVPILDHGFVIGIIHCAHPEIEHFGADHLEICTTIANLASAKIKNAMSLEKQTLIEQQLRDSEKRFRMIVENAADAIYEINPEGYFSYVNPYLYKEQDTPKRNC